MTQRPSVPCNATAAFHYFTRKKKKMHSITCSTNCNFGEVKDRKAFNTEVQTHSVLCSRCQVWPKFPAMSESYRSQPTINLNYPLLFSEWKGS